MTATHYERLGVAPTSTPEEIRLAYLRQARSNHPDKVAGSDPERVQQQELAMVAINAAWFVLGNQERRRLYDQELDRASELRSWEQEEADWMPETEESYDWTSSGSDPPYEYGAQSSPAAKIARLYAVVMMVVIVLLGIAFFYAVLGSGLVTVIRP